MSDAVAWHDLECGLYDADLPLWRKLARHAGGPILELGAGTGRVTLDLARRGHAVTAVDSDAELLQELEARAERSGVELQTICADARRLPETHAFALAIAPMQFLQIMGGSPSRAALLRGVADRLPPGGTFAGAITDVEEAVAAEGAPAPLPDVGERGDWVFSSLPLDVRPHSRGVLVERLRHRVSPAGELSEERHAQILDALSAKQLEQEAAEQGLRPVERLELAETRDYVGSTVIVCRR